MSTPIGHTLVGLALARRLGVCSPAGMTAATVAASIPDVDVIAGLVLHGDAWRLHRKGTHTLGFAMTAGMLGGFMGLVSAGSAEGERDLVADAVTGAIIAGSHVLLDNMPFPYLPTKKGTPRRTRIVNHILNWSLDAVVYGVIARALWPAGGGGQNSAEGSA